MLECIEDYDKQMFVVSARSISTNRGRGNTKKWFITEDGLYDVLMQSRKPIAKTFRLYIKRFLKDVRRSYYSGSFQSFYDDVFDSAGYYETGVEDIYQSLDAHHGTHYYRFSNGKMWEIADDEYDKIDELVKNAQY